MTALAGVEERMRAGDFAGALALLPSDSEQAPTESLYLAAVCHRYLRQYAAAEDCLRRLLAQEPEHGRALQERGHLCRDQGDHAGAAAAYARACRANPALEASFRGLLATHEALGNSVAAQQARAQLEHLRALPRPIAAAMDLLAQGRIVRAETLCRKFLQQVPRHVEGMRLLADIAQRLGALEEAEFLLESAVLFEPGNLGASIDYVGILGRRQKFRQAREEAAKLLEGQPDNLQLQSLYAVECLKAGDCDAALEGFDRILERLPGDPTTLTSKGHALKTRGDAPRAIAAYRGAIAAQPRHGEAWYALANLKTYRFADEDVMSMERQLEADIATVDRVHLHFALGKAYEDGEDYGASFRHYEQGNRYKRLTSAYDADVITREFEAQKAVCDRALFERFAGTGSAAEDPIFIVGLPRAGSTLIEQILASHSEVDGTMELPNILSLVTRLRRTDLDGGRPGYPGILPMLGPDEFRDFGEQFIADTRSHRGTAPRFTDKMPNNFRHIGLIRLMLPRARIIDARRHPMACCFGAYKQLFAEGQEFSYALEDLGRYYRDYVDLMAHWDEVLPGFVLRVQHEELVADLEGQVRRLLDFCGLPFEAQCLRFFETERHVRTPSSEQVRQPIYTTALEHWRHYEPWLDPLRDALGPAIAGATHARAEPVSE